MIHNIAFGTALVLALQSGDLISAKKLIETNQGTVIEFNSKKDNINNILVEAINYTDYLFLDAQLTEKLEEEFQLN